MFVLEEVMRACREGGEPFGRALMTALGPGFSAGFILIEDA
jgi:predicted naringenin-chalcone synthase